MVDGKCIAECEKCGEGQSWNEKLLKCVSLCLRGQYWKDGKCLEFAPDCDMRSYCLYDNKKQIEEIQTIINSLESQMSGIESNLPQRLLQAMMPKESSSVSDLEKRIKTLEKELENTKELYATCANVKCPNECDEFSYDEVHQTCINECKEGQQIDEKGNCITLECPKGYTLNDDSECEKIYCEDSYVLVGDYCVRDSCPDGFIVEGEHCVTICDNDFKYNMKTNLCEQTSCPNGKYMWKGKCIDLKCPPGYDLTKDKKCVKLYCDDGWKLEGKHCVRDSCPKGFTLTKGYCVKHTECTIRKQCREFKSDSKMSFDFLLHLQDQNSRRLNSKNNTPAPKRRLNAWINPYYWLKEHANASMDIKEAKDKAASFHKNMNKQIDDYTKKREDMNHNFFWKLKDNSFVVKSDHSRSSTTSTTYRYDSYYCELFINIHSIEECESLNCPWECEGDEIYDENTDICHVPCEKDEVWNGHECTKDCPPDRKCLHEADSDIAKLTKKISEM